MTEMVEMVTVVAAGKSVLRPDKPKGSLSERLLKPGSILRPGKLGFTEESIASLVRRGRAVKVPLGTEIPDRTAVPAATVPIIPHESDVSEGTGIGDMRTKPIPDAKSGSSPKWGFNPEGLKRAVEGGQLNLEKLNVMIKERDAERPPAPTIEDAIATLSAEFNPAPAPPAPPAPPQPGG